MDFVHLDAGSEWAAWVTPYVFLAEGNVAAGAGKREEHGQGSQLSSGIDGGVHAAQRPADMDKIVREAESSAMMEPDPEAWYHVGALMAYCGQKECGVAFAESRSAAELLRLFGAAGRSFAEGACARRRRSMKF